MRALAGCAETADLSKDEMEELTVRHELAARADSSGLLEAVSLRRRCVGCCLMPLTMAVWLLWSLADGQDSSI